MIGYRFLRTAALALELYGILGLAIAAAMLVVGLSTFAQIALLQKTLDNERASLVQSIRTVSGTVHDTAASTSDFQRSIDRARTAADSASTLANSTAGTFRSLATSVNISVFGVQPLAAVAPQFEQSADQLQQLAISLGATRDSLAQNGNDVARVGNDLAQLQGQLDAVANSLSQPGVLGFGPQTLLPFEVAFFGMCLLVILQSAFSLVAGVMLFRMQRALGSEALFPALRGRRGALPGSADGEPERLPLRSR
jgi:HPt (histidine-containing phosphotransfer) domain-containing protein